MENNLRRSALAANAAVDAELALLNGGYLRIYSGPQPASADDSISNQKLLVELRFSDPAFSPAIDGEAVSKSIAVAKVQKEGHAKWFRASTSEGGTVFDGSVGTDGANINLPTVSLVAGMKIEVENFTYAAPKK